MKKWAGIFINAAAATAKSLQSCPTLCDPIDGSPPGSTVPGILQARTLEWVAMSFSNACKWKVKVKSLSCVRLFITPWTTAYQATLSMEFSTKSTGVGCHCLLQSLATIPLFPSLVSLILDSKSQIVSHHSSFWSPVSLYQFPGISSSHSFNLKLLTWGSTCDVFPLQYTLDFTYSYATVG